MYYDRMDGGSGGGWVVMLVIMILLIALAAVAVWFFVTNARRHAAGASSPSTRPSATDLLDERLARGEISPDEYRERLAALRERDQAG
jgi:putative membrane protein